MLFYARQKCECATENYFVIFGTRQPSYDKSQKSSYFKFEIAALGQAMLNYSSYLHHHRQLIKPPIINWHIGNIFLRDSRHIISAVVL